MSGLMGSIERTSIEFNNLAANDKMKGIKTAYYLKERIERAEKEIEGEKLNPEKEETLDTENLVQEIQEDMER